MQSPLDVSQSFVVSPRVRTEVLSVEKAADNTWSVCADNVCLRLPVEVSQMIVAQVFSVKQKDSVRTSVPSIENTIVGQCSRIVLCFWFSVSLHSPVKMSQTRIVH